MPSPFHTPPPSTPEGKGRLLAGRMNGQSDAVARKLKHDERRLNERRGGEGGGGRGGRGGEGGKTTHALNE